jgi:hypothetical protein
MRLELGSTAWQSNRAPLLVDYLLRGRQRDGHSDILRVFLLVYILIIT